MSDRVLVVDYNDDQYSINEDDTDDTSSIVENNKNDNNVGQIATTTVDIDNEKVEEEEDTTTKDDNYIIRRLQEENRHLRHTLNETKLALEDLQEKDRYESTKLIELQDVVNCMKHNDPTSIATNSSSTASNIVPTTNELLIQKSLRVAHLSCLVDDLRTELRELKLEHNALKKQTKKHNQQQEQQIEPTVAVAESDTEACDHNDDNEETENVNDLSFSTATTVLTSVSSTFSSSTTPTPGQRNNDGVDERTQTSESETVEDPIVQVWQKKCESLETSLATMKQQMKERQIKTTINMKRMQRQISILEKEKKKQTSLLLRRRSSSRGSGSSINNYNMNNSSNNDENEHHQHQEPPVVVATAVTARMFGRRMVNNLRPLFGGGGGGSRMEGSNAAKVVSSSA